MGRSSAAAVMIAAGLCATAWMPFRNAKSGSQSGGMTFLAPQIDGETRVHQDVKPSSGFKASSFAASEASSSSLPLFAGAALLASGALAAAASKTRRCVSMSAAKKPIKNAILQEVIPSKERYERAEESEDAIWKAKLDAIKSAYPEKPGEFENKVDDYGPAWRREVLPYTSARRTATAMRKKNMVMRNKAFFQDMEYLKPLAMKYPQVGNVTDPNWLTGNSQENYWEYKVDSHMYNNTERCAGFSYEDFVKEYKEKESESWKLPQVGDEVTGTVMHFTRSGCFIDIGAKKWAFVPLNLMSMIALSTSSDIFQIGDQVEGTVISTNSRSKLVSEEQTQMPIVSLIEVEKRKGKEEVAMILSGGGEAEDGTKVTNQQMVTVLQLRAGGAAIVQMRNGLKGIVLPREMGARAGDSSLVGQEVMMTLVRAREGDNETPVEFSFRNTLIMGLKDKIKEGYIAEAKVESISDVAVDIMIEGVKVEMRKRDISQDPSNEWTPADVFQPGEEIKVYIAQFDAETGTLVCRTSVLEADKPGRMIRAKEICFDRAELAAEAQRAQDARRKAEMAKAVEDAAGKLEALDTPTGGTGNLDDELELDAGF
mmetsp:Transcript_23603/g.54967  ORF Transcript_23603/g.54967 Transcript_23603/m.54967 type:complete len:598 (+) Transcript_23603:99-1892(+)